MRVLSLTIIGTVTIVLVVLVALVVLVVLVALVVLVVLVIVYNAKCSFLQKNRKTTLSVDHSLRCKGGFIVTRIGCTHSVITVIIVIIIIVRYFRLQMGGR